MRTSLTFFVKVIDTDPSPVTRQKCNQLIENEVSADSQNVEHPSLPSLYQPRFSAIADEELKRIANTAKTSGSTASKGHLKAIDLSRYEALDPPNPDASPEQWTRALRQAKISESYLSERTINLGLLEKFGKNSWLIGNSSLEDINARLQSELADVRRQLEEVEGQRQAKQASVNGELTALEDSWREGIERMLATKAAAEKLRLELLEELGRVANA